MSEPEPPLAPRPDPEASGEATPSAIATTTARALALGAALTTPVALLGLDDDLEAIGLYRRPAPWGPWASRQQIVEASDRVLARYDALNDVRERELTAYFPRDDGDEPPVPERAARIDMWGEVSTGRSQATVVAWLRLLMTDREPVSAAAAAAALSSWQRPRDTAVPEPLERAKTLLQTYSESRWPDAREIARAARRGADDEPGRLPLNEGRPAPEGSTSIMVHGTFGYVQTWWLKGGDFHGYVKHNVRPDLFDGRNAFDWSGVYRGNHRRVAAERLAGWVEATIGGPVNAVFAHSYGGIVTLSATTEGLKMRDLVLLSVPAERVAVEWRNVGRAVSLRIHMDLVLLAARRRQRFTENVEEYVLPRWFRHHGDSHDPAVWDRYGCKAMLDL